MRKCLGEGELMNIELMTPQTEDLYEVLNRSKETHLLYTSLVFRNFLKKILPGADEQYLLAFNHGMLVGALPAFSLEGKYGTVINSLPFYGSNGGILTAPLIENASLVKTELLEAFNDLAVEKNAVATTIISNPLEPDHEFYDTHTKYTLIDKRIGQITHLPGEAEASPDKDIEEALMNLFHSKTRNMVRKSQKSGFSVTHSNNESVLRALYTLHTDNLRSIGGLSKPWNVFSAIRDTFKYNDEYRAYFAEYDGQVVAALLLFYYNKTVEYYTPAVHVDFRSKQPMSLLIFESMCDACKAGYKYWNWGGTWLTQESVYLFKKRWGAEDLAYKYYIREQGNHTNLRQYKQNELIAAYPMFYTVPFMYLEE